MLRQVQMHRRSVVTTDVLGSLKLIRFHPFQRHNAYDIMSPCVFLDTRGNVINKADRLHKTSTFFME